MGLREAGEWENLSVKTISNFVGFIDSLHQRIDFNLFFKILLLTG